MADTPKFIATKALDAVIDSEGRSSSPTFMRNRQLTKGAEGGMEGFKLRSKLLKAKLSKHDVEVLIDELTKINITTIEELSHLDHNSVLSLPVRPKGRVALLKIAKSHLDTFRLKELLLESNRFEGNSNGNVEVTCDKLARSLYSFFGLKSWKEFFQISSADLAQVPELSAEECRNLAELAEFGREVNWGGLKKQFEYVQQTMDLALRSYNGLIQHLSTFQHFVKAGAPLDGSLNDVYNLTAKAFEQRDVFIKAMSGNQSVAEAIEEDPVTHTSRPTVLIVTPGSNWKSENVQHETSFSQIMRSLTLDSSIGTKPFGKSFIDSNIPFINFVAEKPSSSGDSDTEYAIVTVEKKKNPVPNDTSMLLIQGIDGDSLTRCPAVAKSKDMVELISKTPALCDYDILRVKDFNGEFAKSLVQLENKLSVTNFKIGVLYVKEGQTREEEILSNSPGSDEYEAFLNLLGSRIALKGCKLFSGGLDTRDNRNGAHSIFATAADISIMLHVATMMPYEPTNEEHLLERKRHIGNDIACIVFCEPGATFNPSCIRSEFLHVYAIVSPVVFNNRTYYRLQIASKEMVSKFGPSIPSCLFPKSPKFAQYLIIKLLNAESAAGNAPVFKKRMMRTRNGMMFDVVAEHRKAMTLKREMPSDSKTQRTGSANFGFKSVRSKGGIKFDEEEMKFTESKEPKETRPKLQSSVSNSSLNPLKSPRKTTAESNH